MKLRILMAALAALFVGLAGADEPQKPTGPAIRSIRKAADPTPASPLKLSGVEFDLLVLDNYKGPVTWDITTPDGTEAPLKWYELVPKQVIIGLQASANDVDKYEAPDQPAVALFGKMDANRNPVSGKALVVAYGVVDGKAKKLASKLVECNLSPLPPPPPPPPPSPVDPVLPAGKFGLAKFAFDTAKVTVLKDSLGQAKALAGAYRKVAGGSAASPQDVLKAAKSEAGLVTTAAKWDTFGVALQDKLFALYESKALKTTQDFKDALIEIAQGLEVLN